MNVNDIITESQHTCPHCGGPLVEYSDLMEKKDACYYKVKASAKVWPSAYASGRLVQCRKKGAGNYGNKSEGVAEGSTTRGGFGGSASQAHHEIEWLKKKIASLPPTKEKQIRDLQRQIRERELAIAYQGQGVAEGWSQKYKSSINCSHPKGFSQKAHCAGKKKHNESVEMEMVCEDCGMCETHGNHSGDNLDEACGQDALARILELGGVPLMEQAHQQFDMIEEMVEQLAEQHGVDADEIWEDFESVDDHELLETAAWRRSAGKSAKGGLNAKGVASYRRENPGSKLQMAVTTKPSKLKPGSKAAKRRKSFCARMGGVKGPMKKPNGKPTRKALALRKWNC